MSTLAPTPHLGLVLPEPNTNEPFSTAVINGWFNQIDAGVGADRAKISPLEAFKNDVDQYVTNTNQIGLIIAGTPAERDAYFGLPGTPDQRGALAQRGRWFNRDRGWNEQYYAQPGDPADWPLTRPVAGWYPVGGSAPRFMASKIYMGGLTVVPTGWGNAGLNCDSIWSSGTVVQIRVTILTNNATSGADRSLRVRFTMDGNQIFEPNSAFLIPFTPGGGIATSCTLAWQGTVGIGPHNFGVDIAAGVADSIQIMAGSSIQIHEMIGLPT